MSCGSYKPCMEYCPYANSGNQSQQHEKPPTAGRSGPLHRETIEHFLLAMPELFALGLLQCLINDTHSCAYMANARTSAPTCKRIIRVRRPTSPSSPSWLAR